MPLVQKGVLEKIGPKGTVSTPGPAKTGKFSPAAESLFDNLAALSDKYNADTASADIKKKTKSQMEAIKQELRTRHGLEPDNMGRDDFDFGNLYYSDNPDPFISGKGTNNPTGEFLKNK